MSAPVEKPPHEQTAWEAMASIQAGTELLRRAREMQKAKEPK